MNAIEPRDVNTKVVEGLFAGDLNYLQKLYEELNLDDLDTAEHAEHPSSPGFRVVGKP